MTEDQRIRELCTSYVVVAFAINEGSDEQKDVLLKEISDSGISNELFSEIVEEIHNENGMFDSFDASIMYHLKNIIKEVKKVIKEKENV